MTNQEIIVEVQLDTVGYPNKPKEEIQYIKTRVQNSTPVKMTLTKLLEEICKGKTVSPAVLVGGCKDENWNRQQLFMVDIDNDDIEVPELTVEKAIEICNQKNIPLAFYYHSFSSSEYVSKYRLGFIMDKVVTDKDERFMIQKGLVNLFYQADKKCKNGDRIFYGTNKGYEIVNTTELCSVGAILNANRKNSSKYNTSTNSNSELEELKKNFDLLNLMIEDNGDIAVESDNYIMFEDCCICTHHKDLVYFKDDNSFFCFSSENRIGGSCIDYYMASRNVTLKEAIDDLLANNIKPIGTTKKSSASKKSRGAKQESLLPISSTMQKNKNSVLQTQLKELKPEKNFSMDDTGAGNLLAETCKHRNLYVPALNKWITFNNKKHWMLDEKEVELNKNITILLDNLAIYANGLSNSNIKIDYLKYLKRLRSNSSRKNMIETAKSNMYFDMEKLDGNKNLFNCQNGTINLQTFILQPHNSIDYITKMSNVVYDPRASSEVFEKFIAEVLENDEEKIQYLQKLLGYSLTGESKEEAFYILFGSKTRNGKSTLIETYSYMLGGNKGYAVNIDPSTLAEKKNKDSSKASGDIARLRGYRFISCTEPNENMVLDVALIKQLTGGDTITSRALYNSEKEFSSCGKIFINTNHLPMVNDETIFTSNRTKVIEFNRSFAPEEQDKTLKDRLKEEENLSGLLNWCLQGLKKYYEEGLEPPESVKKAIKYYSDISNNICIFVETQLVPNEDYYMKGGEVYLEYEKWCKEEGEDCIGKNKFFEKLRKLHILHKTYTINSNTEKNIVVGYKVK